MSLMFVTMMAFPFLPQRGHVIVSACLFVSTGSAIVSFFCFWGFIKAVVGLGTSFNYSISRCGFFKMKFYC